MTDRHLVLADVHALAVRLRESINQVIVGKDDVINLALTALLCNGHVLIEDVPGIGKTTLARTMAQSLGCTFKRIQFTPDLMPADVLGINFYNQKTSEFEFQPGPIFSQVLLADEINRGTPRTQSALLESMQESQSTVDGETRQLPSPFLVLATQNPIEMEGTFPLPEAQLDRFMVRIKLGYPSKEEESDILLRFGRNIASANVDAVTNSEELKLAQDAVPTVRVDDTIREYVVSVVQATRIHSALALGASPRAALALYKTSQAHAAINDRNYITPDDIKAMCVPVLAHRILLNSTSRLTGQSADAILEDILGAVPVPIER